MFATKNTYQVLGQIILSLVHTVKELEIKHTRAWFTSHRALYNYKLDSLCACCQKKKAECFHHILPLSLGGTNYDSNIIGICSECHSKIHDTKATSIGEVTKKGLEKARANGKQIGNKKGTKLITIKSIETKIKILELHKEFDGTLNNEDCIKEINISRNSFFKYIKELRRLVKQVGSTKETKRILIEQLENRYAD